MKLSMRDWAWTDIDQPLSRWSLFFRSAEFLTTAFLWGYAFILIFKEPTVASFPAFAWLSKISGGDDTFWSVASLTLGIVSPLAVLFNDGRLRIMSLLSQGVFYTFLGLGAFVNSRYGFGWITFLLCGGWLLWRTIELALPRLKTTIDYLRHEMAR